MPKHTEQLGKCYNCESEFNIDAEGHIDCETGIEFCCQECEIAYDRQIGLPDDYKKNPN